VNCFGDNASLKDGRVYKGRSGCERGVETQKREIK